MSEFDQDLCHERASERKEGSGRESHPGQYEAFDLNHGSEDLG
jgi:hypothetical protein